MKKILLAGFAITCFSAMVFAQNGKVTNAYLLYKDGQYEQAREYIDEAIKHPKTMGKSKTWNYRGLIYEKLAAASKSGELLVTAAESHDKAIEINDNKGVVSHSEKRKTAIYNDVLNWAYEKYEAKDLEGALSIYEAGIKISPKDTTAYLYGSSVLMDLQDYDKLIKINKDLIATGFNKEKVYFNVLIGQLGKQTREDSLAALETLESAINDNPGSGKLPKTRIDIQIALGKKDEALKSINSQLANEPDNPLLWCLKGTLQTGEEAEKSFQTSHAKITDDTKPQMVEFINFSIGNIYYNRAAEMYNTVNDMGFSEYQKKGKKLEAEAKAVMEQSIPYFEKAYQVNKQQREENPKIGRADDVIQSLVTAYQKVGRTSDSEKMANILTGK